jgi:hypothetical protein
MKLGPNRWQVQCKRAFERRGFGVRIHNELEDENG